MPEKWVLRQYQALPLKAKVNMSINRIEAWYEHFDGNVCVSFSGGKDSTVLAHLVHRMYPQVPLVFANTGLEYPEIQAFAKKMGAEFVRPKMSFSEVISQYGYPVISKENAEAIYYARRIKNGGGTWRQTAGEDKSKHWNGDGLESEQTRQPSMVHTDAKRIEFFGKRLQEKTISGNRGGVHQSESALNCEEKEDPG